MCHPPVLWQVSHGNNTRPSTQTHTNNFTSEWACFNFLSFSFAWQMRYCISTCLHLQIKAKEFPSKRTYPVIWQKWHLLSGHDYTRMVKIMVLHTEINLNGALSWHFSNKILNLEALNENIFMFDCTNHMWKITHLILILTSCTQTDKIGGKKSLHHVYTFNFSCHNLPSPTHKRPLQGKKCV